MRHSKYLIEITIIILISIYFKINLTSDKLEKKLTNFEDYLATGTKYPIKLMTIKDWEKISFISTSKAVEILTNKIQDCYQLGKIKGLGEKKLKKIYQELLCEM